MLRDTRKLQITLMQSPLSCCFSKTQQKTPSCSMASPQPKAPHGPQSTKSTLAPPPSQQASTSQSNIFMRSKKGSDNTPRPGLEPGAFRYDNAGKDKAGKDHRWPLLGHNHEDLVYFSPFHLFFLSFFKHFSNALPLSYRGKCVSLVKDGRRYCCTCMQMEKRSAFVVAPGSFWIAGSG